jgi:hypothetical protein
LGSGFNSDNQKTLERVKGITQTEDCLMKKIYVPATKPEDWKPFLADPKPSQPDPFILAKNESEMVSMAVKGKALEPFSNTVAEWLNEFSSGRKTRLNYLCEMLGLKQERLSNIRYQLLHRTVSAIIEAKRFNAQNALMLVHSFKENKEFFQDYSNFLGLFGIEAEKNKIYSAGKRKNVNLYLGWVDDFGDYGTDAGGPTKGTVTSKKCGHCGHHEIGITTDSGEYISLKPGMKAEINE